MKTVAAGMSPWVQIPESRHSFGSLLSERGVPLEGICRLVGHSGTAAIEEVHQKRIRLVNRTGAVVMHGIFDTQERRPQARGWWVAVGHECHGVGYESAHDSGQRTLCARGG